MAARAALKGALTCAALIYRASMKKGDAAAASPFSWNSSKL
jgi:hypothetical protein